MINYNHSKYVLEKILNFDLLCYKPTLWAIDNSESVVDNKLYQYMLKEIIDKYNNSLQIKCNAGDIIVLN